MKLIITVSFVFIAAFLYAQEPKQITIQKVKESRKIDSLLRTIRREIGNGEKYFCFEIWRSESGYSCNFFQTISKSSKILLPFSKPEDLTFFEWRGYTIFLAEDENSFHLFRKVNSWKSFSVREPGHDLMDQFPNLFFGVFSYRNGKFERDELIVH